jgi:terminase small subunit-like protein
MDKSALPLVEVLYDPEEIDRRYAEFERQEAQKKIDRLAEVERLEDVARRKERLPLDRGIAAEICEQIAEGGVLKAVCASRENFPSSRQARRWLRGNEAFAAEYAKACEERLQAWEDEIVLIADDASKDKVEKRMARGLVLETDAAAVSRSKLRVDARRSLLRANNPTKWGEAIAVVNPEPKDMFANMSLDEIEELARAAELEEIVEQKRALDRENEQRRTRGEKLLVLRIERREEQA